MGIGSVSRLKVVGLSSLFVIGSGAFFFSGESNPSLIEKHQVTRSKVLTTPFLSRDRMESNGVEANGIANGGEASSGQQPIESVSTDPYASEGVQESLRVSSQRSESAKSSIAESVYSVTEVSQVKGFGNQKVSNCYVVEDENIEGSTVSVDSMQTRLYPVDTSSLEFMDTHRSIQVDVVSSKNEVSNEFEGESFLGAEDSFAIFSRRKSEQEERFFDTYR